MSPFSFFGFFVIELFFVTILKEIVILLATKQIEFMVLF